MACSSDDIDTQCLVQAWQLDRPTRRQAVVKDLESLVESLARVPSVEYTATITSSGRTNVVCPCRKSLLMVQATVAWEP